MRLLIVTQAVDKNDSVLGFFHRWLEEFAVQCESVVVVCLFEGAHTLPDNVRVYSLGKEEGPLSRSEYIKRFWRLIARRRHDYDAVFVHMNPEYVVLGALLWRAWGKPVGLWYVHKSVTLLLRVATLCADFVFTASKESFRIETDKRIVLGHGIDTEFFSPDPTVARGDHVLSAGRLFKTKRHDLAIRAAARAGKELWIAGEGPEREALEELAKAEGGVVKFLGGISQEEQRDEYRRAACLVHTSETGSIDKVVLEALATNTPVVSTATVFEGFPVDLVPDSLEKLAEALRGPLRRNGLSSIVREEHSLPQLITRIIRRYVRD